MVEGRFCLAAPQGVGLPHELLPRGMERPGRLLARGGVSAALVPATRDQTREEDEVI